MSYIDATDTKQPKRSPRELWADGKPALGCMLMIPSALSAEIVVAAGYEWVCIDTQHGLMGSETTLSMVQALDQRVTTIIRVAWNEPELIMKALDTGADGVIVPMVNNRADAEAAASAFRFPPRGIRSWGQIRSALGHPDFSPETENERVFCAVMIETEEAMGNLEEIMSVEGVDAVFVGPSDLSISAMGGLQPAGATPEGTEMIQSVLEAARRHNLVTGLAVSGAEVAAPWRDAGFQMVAIHNDAGLLAEAARSHLEAAAPKNG